MGSTPMPAWELACPATEVVTRPMSTVTVVGPWKAVGLSGRAGSVVRNDRTGATIPVAVGWAAW